MTRSPLLLSALLIHVVCASLARAHGDSLSTLRLALRDTSVHASLTLHFRDLSDWVPAGPPDYPAAVAAEMRTHALELIQLKYDDTVVQPLSFSVSTATVGSVDIDWTYPPIAATEAVEVQSLHLEFLPVGHHQSFFAEDDRSARGKHLQQALIANETLGREETLAVVDVPKISRPTAPHSSEPTRPAALSATAPKSFPTTWYLLPLALAAAAFLSWRVVSLRSNLKPAGPFSAPDQPGRTSS